MLKFLAGLLVGVVGTALVARNNAKKAKAAIDKAASISKV